MNPRPMWSGLPVRLEVEREDKSQHQNTLTADQVYAGNVVLSLLSF